MSSIITGAPTVISQGPIGAAAGIASGVAGMVKAFTQKPTLMQFELNPDDAASKSAPSNVLLTFDCIIGDTLTRQSQPTAYPIEDASSITDHITRLPLQLDLVGIVTDTPIGPTKDLFTQEAVTTAVTAILPPLGVVAAGAGAGFINGTLHDTKDSLESRPSRKALQILTQLQNGDPTQNPPSPPRPFVATSRIGRWENMMIANLTVPRDAQTGDSLVFNISLVQVNVVSAQTVPLPRLANPLTSGDKTQCGSQPSGQVTDQNEQQKAQNAMERAGNLGRTKAHNDLGESQLNSGGD